MMLVDTAAFFAGAGVMGGQTSLIVLAGAFYPTFIWRQASAWALASAVRA